MSDNLLARLEKADPETYQKAFDWLKNVAWGIIKSDPEKYFLEPGPYPLRDAILQAVLQDAIRTHEWDVTQNQFLYDNSYINYAKLIIHYKNGPYTNKFRECFGKGDSPTHALLEAYLFAIEVQT